MNKQAVLILLSTGCSSLLHCDHARALQQFAFLEQGHELVEEKKKYKNGNDIIRFGTATDGQSFWFHAWDWYEEDDLVDPHPEAGASAKTVPSIVAYSARTPCPDSMQQQSEASSTTGDIKNKSLLPIWRLAVDPTGAPLVWVTELLWVHVNGGAAFRTGAWAGQPGCGGPDGTFQDVVGCHRLLRIPGAVWWRASEKLASGVEAGPYYVAYAISVEDFGEEIRNRSLQLQTLHEVARLYFNHGQKSLAGALNVFEYYYHPGNKETSWAEQGMQAKIVISMSVQIRPQKETEHKGIARNKNAAINYQFGKGEASLKLHGFAAAWSYQDFHARAGVEEMRQADAVGPMAWLAECYMLFASTIRPAGVDHVHDHASTTRPPKPYENGAVMLNLRDDPHKLFYEYDKEGFAEWMKKPPLQEEEQTALVPAPAPASADKTGEEDAASEAASSS
ncbi:unnamed protein product [Amoebophrya sp. A120]|nr:unnamed protein product [Amoebophrya sp. A120]|eukprot:GSA120T00020807001.1